MSIQPETKGRVLVIAPTESLRQTDGNLIDGEIWLQTDDGQAFPSVDWFDYSARLLGQWLSDLIPFKILAAPGLSRELRFWEGPQVARILVLSEALWSIPFYSRGTAGHPAGELYHFDPEPLLDSPRRGARTTLRWCDLQGWESQDLDGLRGHRGEFELR